MVTALILSGGIGSRIGGDIPKQYIKVEGREIISYCIEALSGSECIDALWIVAAQQWQERIRLYLNRFDVGRKFRGFSLPGENRQLSVYHGICDIRDWAANEGSAPRDDFVFIHDAARPLITKTDIQQYVSAVRGHDGVLPVLPMKDTVYLSSDGQAVTGLLDRGQVYAGQAPEVFRLDKYIEANERLICCKAGSIAGDSEIFGVHGSTEPAVRAGLDIVMVSGDEMNFKITTAEDLERLRQILSRKERG